MNVVAIVPGITHLGHVSNKSAGKIDHYPFIGTHADLYIRNILIAIDRQRASVIIAEDHHIAVGVADRL